MTDGLPVSRGRFLVRAGTALGGAATVLGLARHAAASPDSVPVYVLDSTAAACGCDACAACRSHAANSYFSSATSADLERAHPNCRCAVVQSGVLPYATWVNLFGLPTAVARPRVDRRWPWVADALAVAATAPTLDAGANETTKPRLGSNDTSPARATKADTASIHPLRARLSARCIRVGAAKRQMAIRFQVSRAATAHVDVVDGSGRKIVSATFHLVPGTSFQLLRVPNGVKAGRYGLHARFDAVRAKRVVLLQPLTIT